MVIFYPLAWQKKLNYPLKLEVNKKQSYWIKQKIKVQMYFSLLLL